jgi:hypothetical protein
MSLTNEIKSPASPIHAYFNNHYAPLKNFILAENKKLIGKSLLPLDENHYPWQLVGHATEYLLDLHLSLPMDKLFPFNFVDSYPDFFDNWSNIQPPYHFDTDFERICTILFKLAQIESNARSGCPKDSLYKPNQVILDDLHHIYQQSIIINPVFNDDFDNISFYYNPTFTFSNMIGGADADLYKEEDDGNFLIDLKTTKHLKIMKEMIYQLLGYYFLDNDNEHKLSKIGVYFTRQNLVTKWYIEDIILNYSDFNSIQEAKISFIKTLFDMHKQKMLDKLNSGYDTPIWKVL